MTGDAPRTLTSQEFAGAAGISERKARSALRRCFEGGTWRGCRLIITIERGRRGRAGRVYLVQLDSLPPNLQQRALELYPHLALPQAATIQAAAEPAHARRALAPPTLKRKRRTNKTDKRHARAGTRVLTRFLAPCDNETKARVAQLMADTVFTLIAGGTRGRPAIQVLTREYLIETVRALRPDAPEGELEAACTPTDKFIVDHTAAAKKLHAKLHDAKKYYNDGPSAPGDWRKYPPGLLWSLDCTIGDVLYTHADGSERTARIVAMHDYGSGFFDFVAFPLGRGEGITQRHALFAFLTFCWRHETVPGLLKTDNGPELAGWPERLDGLMRAAWPDRCLKGIRDPALPRVMHTLPGRPRNRAVESRFNAFRHACSDIGGFIDSDRMRKPTQTIGRPTKPFDGGFGDLVDALKARRDRMNLRLTKREGGNVIAEQEWDKRPRFAFSPEDMLLDGLPRTERPHALKNGLLKIVRNHVRCTYSHPALDAHYDLKEVITIDFAGRELPEAVAVFDPRKKCGNYYEFICWATPAIGGDGQRPVATRQRGVNRAVAETKNRLRDLDITKLMTGANARDRGKLDLNQAPADLVHITRGGPLGEAARALPARGEPARLPAPAEDEQVIPDFYAEQIAKKKGAKT